MRKTTIATAGALAVLTLGLGAPVAVTTLQAGDSTAVAAPSINAPQEDDEVFSNVGVLGHRGPRDGVKRPGFGGGTDRPVFSPIAEGR